MAEQGVGQGGEAGRQPVQRIVDAGSRAAEQVEKTFAAVAPHGVQRVGQPEEQGAGAAEQGEPEQVPKMASLPFSSTDSMPALATPDSSRAEVSRETIHPTRCRASSRRPSCKGFAMASACSQRLCAPRAK